MARVSRDITPMLEDLGYWKTVCPPTYDSHCTVALTRAVAISRRFCEPRVRSLLFSYLHWKTLHCQCTRKSKFIREKLYFCMQSLLLVWVGDWKGIRNSYFLWKTLPLQYTRKSELLEENINFFSKAVAWVDERDEIIEELVFSLEFST